MLKGIFPLCLLTAQARQVRTQSQTLVFLPKMPSMQFTVQRLPKPEVVLLHLTTLTAFSPVHLATLPLNPGKL